MPEPQIDHHPNPNNGNANLEKSHLSILFWSVLGITTFIRLLYALKLPLTGDEAYFWEWGRHPALGYYDHPPLAGWILWLTRQILGDTVAAVRLPAVLAGTMVVSVIHRYTLDITGSRRSAALTGLLAMGIPVIGVLGVLYSTDTPVIAAGTLGGYFFHRAVNMNDRRAWVWTGASFAVVMGSKFLGVPLICAAGLYLLLHPGARVHLRSAGPYIAGILTLLGIIPVIIWNAANEWATFIFNFASRHSGPSFDTANILDYLAGQALALSPVVFLLAIPLLAEGVPVWKTRDEKGKETAAFLALIPLGGFLLISPFTKVGVHWPGVAVPFLVTALGAKLWTGARIARTYVVASAAAWTITILLFLLPLAPHFLPDDWAYPLRPEKINTAQLKKIMGSPTESGRKVDLILKDMGNEKEVFLFTRSYALSSLLAFYTPGNPEVTVLGEGSVHGRNHPLWFDPAEHKGMDAIFVTYRATSSESDFIEKRFESWEKVIERDGPEGSLVSVIKCYSYKGIR